MSIKLASHLYRNRHGAFYFRFIIPKDLRHLVGQSELRFSLNTECRYDALHSAIQLISELPQLKVDLRRMANDEVKAAGVLNMPKG